MRVRCTFLLAPLLTYSGHGCATQYTYWYIGNFTQPVFSLPKAGCDFLYSDSYWGHLKNRYLPELNSFASDSTYRCAMTSTGPSGYTYFGQFSKKVISCEIGTAFDYNTAKCSYTSQKGRPAKSYTCSADMSDRADNFNQATGNNFLESIDFVSPQYVFSRSFNAVDGIWRHSFSAHLYFVAENVVFVNGDGAEHTFSGSGSILKSNSDLGEIEKSNDGFLYRPAVGGRLKFGSNGVLEAIYGMDNQEITLTPKSGTISIAVLGLEVGRFTEDLLHQPLTFAAAGFSINYTYSSNHLTSLTKSYGGQAVTQNYLYEVSGKPNLLTGTSDERGVRSGTWGYDSQGRVISTMRANGAEKVTLAYNTDGSTTVTNEYGKKATYRFQLVQGVRQIVAIEGAPSPNCPNSNSTFTYDARGLLKTKTDNKGHLTTYEYNERGLEVSRTEAAGTPQARIITTQWHPTLFLKTQITEPERVIRYQYDEQGRQIGQTVTPL